MLSQEPVFGSCLLQPEEVRLHSSARLLNFILTHYPSSLSLSLSLSLLNGCTVEHSSIITPYTCKFVCACVGTCVREWMYLCVCVRCVFSYLLALQTYVCVCVCVFHKNYNSQKYFLDRNIWETNAKLPERSTHGRNEKYIHAVLARNVSGREHLRRLGVQTRMLSTWT